MVPLQNLLAEYYQYLEKMGHLQNRKIPQNLLTIEETALAVPVLDAK